MNKNGMNNKYFKEEFKVRDRDENLYYEEYHACKKSWKMGSFVGVPLGILGGLLISGFQLNDVFWVMSIIMSISSVWVMAAVFALSFTEDFGLSCIPSGILSIGFAVMGFFAGTYVLVWVAIALLGVVFGLWIIGLFIFAMVFPLETLYYRIRYSIEKRYIIKDIKEEMRSAA